MGISSALGSQALIPSGLGFRNAIINGAMQVSQRSAVGTAVTGITSGGYKTADRWDLNMTTFGTWTQTCLADAPAGSGFRNSLRMSCTSAYTSPSASNEIQIRQKIEGQNLQAFAKGTGSAKPFTLSFWVKSYQTGTFIVELEDQDNSRNVSASYTVNESGVWEQKVITLPVDATGQFDNDSNSSLVVIWWLGAGSNFTSGTLSTSWATPVSANRAVGQTNVASSTNNYWQITGVQLENNYQPTTFEHRPVGVELELCKRYFWRCIDPAGSGVFSSLPTRVTIPFHTEMRTAPTSSIGGTLNFWNGITTGTGTTLAGTYNTKNHGQLDFSTGAFASSGQSVSLYTTGGSQFIDFSSEL